MTNDGMFASRTVVPPPVSTMTVAGRSLGVARGGGLNVTLHSLHGVQVIGLGGVVGPDSRLGLYSALNAVFMSAPRRIVIDGSCISDCDRQGLAAFIDAADRALAGGIPLVMAGLPVAHREMLQQLWSSRVTVELCYPSLQCALAAVISKPAATDPTREELLDDVRELHEALNSNRAIEQARGVLMATHGLPAAGALALMRRHCQAQELSLRVCAERLLDVVMRGSAGTSPQHAIDALMNDPARYTDHDLTRHQSSPVTENASA